MASKLKNLNSPNQPGISDFLKGHTPQSRSSVKNDNNKRPLSSPEFSTPPAKKMNPSEQLPPDLKLLYDCLSQQWDQRINPLESKVNALFCDDSQLPQHVEDVKSIKKAQVKIETRLTLVEKENVELKEKLTEIEDQMLETSVVLSGIREDKWEDPGPRRDLVDKELAPLLPGATPDEKLKNAQAINIVKTERVGRYNPLRSRPISIKFAVKKDADWLLTCKQKLTKGIYVEKQYSEETEYQRKRLRPILSAARRLSEYRGKCTMDGTYVKIRGKKYNWDNLHELPENLSPHVVSSRQNANYYGFFGEMNPLSNFHPAPFIHDGIHYATSEQYIQARKADFCGDQEAYHEILQTKSAVKCKQIGKEVKNCDIPSWNAAAADHCYPGIRSKFLQNPGIASFLRNTGTRTIIECCYDDIWGNGKPLSDPNCINPSSYTNQGILGEILERIRDELNNQSTTLEKTPFPMSMTDGHTGDRDTLHVETDPLANQSALHVETPQPE